MLQASATVQKAKERLLASEGKVQKQQLELARYKEQLQSRQAALMELASQRQRLTQELKVSQSALGQLRDRYQALLSERAGLLERGLLEEQLGKLELLELSLHSASEAQTETKAALQSQQKENLKQNQELAQLQARLAELNRQIQERDRELEEVIGANAELHDALAEQTQQNFDLSSRLGEAEAQNADQQARLKHATTNINHLKNRLSGAAETIAKLKEHYRTKQTELEQSNTLNSGLSRRLQQLQQELQSRTAHIAQLEEQLTVHHIRFNRLEESCWRCAPVTRGG